MFKDEVLLVVFYCEVCNGSVLETQVLVSCEHLSFQILQSNFLVFVTAEGKTWKTTPIYLIYEVLKVQMCELELMLFAIDSKCSWAVDHKINDLRMLFEGFILCFCFYF